MPEAKVIITGLLPSHEGIADLVRAGTVRSWGVSNFDEDLLEETVRIAGPGRVACDQVLYHLEERAAEHAVIPACRRLGVAFVAYSPFGAGGPFPKGRDGRRALEEAAAARGVGPRRLALAWTVREEPVFAIPRTYALPHLLDNAAAGDLVLDGSEIARLDAAFPRGPKPRELPTI